MKTSKRYLTGTLLAFLAVPMLIVVYSRFNVEARTPPPPQRTSAAELAALSGFTSIIVEGDFAVEISGAATHAVTYDALLDHRGDFVATVENGTLQLRGFGNRDNTAESVVRISAPALESIEVSYVPSLHVSAVNADALNLRIVAIQDVILENNRIDDLELSGFGIGRINLDGNRFASSEIHLQGDTTVTTSD